MDTNVTEQIYQEIVHTLVQMIPEEWNRVYLYAEYREGYKKVFFYYYNQSQEQPVYSLDITDLFHVPEQEYTKWKNELYFYFTKLWEECKPQNQWTNLTFILDRTGKMNINYGYEDLSEISSVEKQDKWEAEYLT